MCDQEGTDVIGLLKMFYSTTKIQFQELSVTFLGMEHSVVGEELTFFYSSWSSWIKIKMCVWVGVGEEKQRSQMTSHSDICIFQGCVCCNGSAFKSSQAALNSQHLRFPMISRLIFPMQRCIMKNVINILQQISQSYLSIKEQRLQENKQTSKNTNN